jgi:hypothetical protein
VPFTVKVLACRLPQLMAQRGALNRTFLSVERGRDHPSGPQDKCFTCVEITLSPPSMSWEVSRSAVTSDDASVKVSDTHSMALKPQRWAFRANVLGQFSFLSAHDKSAGTSGPQLLDRLIDAIATSARSSVAHRLLLRSEEE